MLLQAQGLQLMPLPLQLMVLSLFLPLQLTALLLQLLVLPLQLTALPLLALQPSAMMQLWPALHAPQGRTPQSHPQL